MKGDRLALCGKLWAACLVLLVSATATQAACPWTTYDQTFTSWRATATPDSEGAYRVTGVRLLMQGPTVDLSAYSLKLYNNGVIVFADQSVTLSVKNIIIESGGSCFGFAQLDMFLGSYWPTRHNHSNDQEP
jgi:hypothetical protein